MNVLVVGGSGLIGGDIALRLAKEGHAVSIMSRKPPVAPSLAELDFVQGDYVNDDFSGDKLSGYDYLVFAAAADIRYVPMDGSVTPEEFYRKTNDIAVPKFFEAARDAGIKKAVYIGTFYPQVAPQQIGVCPYVTSRDNTDQAVRGLSRESFQVFSLNAPFVLGHIEGLEIPHISALVSYAKGDMEGLPVFAPVGGTNHISSRSIAQACVNVFERGEGGKAYLLGDENLSWKEYLELWFEAAGNPQDLEVREDDHPMIPNVIMFAGVGATVSYEAEDMEVLDYDRDQISDLVREVVVNTRTG